MNTPLPPNVVFSSEVSHAFQNNQPLVALESTVITHGLPRPDNLELAKALEDEVRQQGAVPATIGILEGKIHIGLSDAELNFLSYADNVRKISRRDYGIALARKENGGTTVAGTLIAAHMAGIKVFATGGIGGVHRGNLADVSADLPELGRTPLVVVCAGAKAILDLPATLEYLETTGVPIIGYQTDDFPAFYSRSSGLPANVRVESPAEVAAIAMAHWEMGIKGALLVVAPPPADVALPNEVIEVEIRKALQEAEKQKIRGAAVTPYMLSKVSELSGGTSLKANLALLRNNASIAGAIAREFVKYPKLRTA